MIKRDQIRSKRHLFKEREVEGEECETPSKHSKDMTSERRPERVECKNSGI